MNKCFQIEARELLPVEIPVLYADREHVSIDLADYDTDGAVHVMFPMDMPRDTALRLLGMAYQQLEGLDEADLDFVARGQREAAPREGM